MTQNGIELCPVVCVIPCSTHRCRRFGGTILVHALPEEVHNTFHRNVAIYIYIYIYTHTHTHTRVGTLIVANIYLKLIQNTYMFRSFTVLQCSHQHCVQPVASDVEVVGYL